MLTGKMEFIFGVMILGFFAATLCADNGINIDDLMTRESELIRNVLERASPMFFQKGWKQKQNVAFSPVRLFATMAAIYSVGSSAVRTELQSQLGLYGSVEKHQCLALHSLLKTLCPKDDGQSVNILYNTNLFYQKGLTIRSSALQSDCIRNLSSAVDFRKPQDILSTINKWFSDLTMGEYEEYLKNAPARDNQLVFMNGINIDLTAIHSYHSDGEINFQQLSGTINEVKAMSKVSSVYFKEDEEKVMIREDQEGNDVYTLIVMPKNVKTDDVGHFIKHLSVLRPTVEEASRLKARTNMKIKIPEIDIEMRWDIQETIKDIFSRKIFEHGAIEGLFQKPVHLRDYLYSEFFHFVGTKRSPRKEVTGKVMEINKPFIYLLVAKDYSVPLQAAIYMGYPNEKQ